MLNANEVRDVACLSVRPLSGDWVKWLESLSSSKVWCLTLGDLRRRPAWRMVLELRKVRCRRLIIALEDENSRALTPAMKLLAAGTRARDLALATPDRTLHAWSRASVAREVATLVGASVAAAGAALACALERPTTSRGPSDTVAGRGRALYLNANLWFGLKAGGSVGHISGVANGLMDAGFDLDFATCGSRLLVDDRARLIPLVVPSAFGLPFELNYYRFTRMVERQLRSQAASQGYSFIYQRLSLADSSGARLARRSRVPLVVEYNGSEVWVARNWGRPLRFEGLALRAEEELLREADLVVTVSHVLGEELRERGVPSDRILVYPNCVDPVRFDPRRYSANDSKTVRHRYSVPEEATVVTFVGTFGRWHGAPVFAHAIRNLVQDAVDLLRRRRLHFLFVGDGAELPIVSQILSGPAFGGLVTMTGLVPQEEAPALMAASDILVSPHVPNADGSPFFGSPTKLFEYMAMEKTIIASEIGQIAEVLSGSLRMMDLEEGIMAEAGDAPALLCKPGSVTDLAHGIALLSGNRALRDSLARNARDRVLQRYTWQHHVEAILARLRDFGVTTTA